MRRLTIGMTLIAALMGGACGGDAPREPASTASPRPPGDPELLKELARLAATAPADAVARLDAYVVRYPTDPGGHFELAHAIESGAPVLTSDFTAADRAAVERAARHARRVLDLTADEELRAAACSTLTWIYSPLRLNRPEEVIEPAKQLIAMSRTLSDPHLRLADALADLKRTDEAMQLWRDALTTLRDSDRRYFAVGIRAFTISNPDLTDAQIETLVTLLTKIATEGAQPEALAHAEALSLRALRLEKNAAAKRALLDQEARWRALADQQGRMTMEEVKAAVDELTRLSAARRE